MKTCLIRRLANVFVAVLLGVASLPAIAGDAPKAMDPAAGPEIKIDNFTFSAPTITVAAGTQVTWINRDDMPHTVTSDDQVFKSKVLDTDEKFSFTFHAPGAYRYFCSIHPKMTGEVIVR